MGQAGVVHLGGQGIGDGVTDLYRTRGVRSLAVGDRCLCRDVNVADAGAGRVVAARANNSVGQGIQGIGRNTQVIADVINPNRSASRQGADQRQCRVTGEAARIRGDALERITHARGVGQGQSVTQLRIGNRNTQLELDQIPDLQRGRTVHGVLAVGDRRIGDVVRGGADAGADRRVGTGANHRVGDSTDSGCQHFCTVGHAIGANRLARGQTADQRIHTIAGVIADEAARVGDDRAERQARAHGVGQDDLTRGLGILNRDSQGVVDRVARHDSSGRRVGLGIADTRITHRGRGRADACATRVVSTSTGDRVDHSAAGVFIHTCGVNGRVGARQGARTQHTLDVRTRGADQFRRRGHKVLERQAGAQSVGQGHRSTRLRVRDRDIQGVGQHVIEDHRSGGCRDGLVVGDVRILDGDNSRASTHAGRIVTTAAGHIVADLNGSIGVDLSLVGDLVCVWLHARRQDTDKRRARTRRIRTGELACIGDAGEGQAGTQSIAQGHRRQVTGVFDNDTQGERQGVANLGRGRITVHALVVGDTRISQRSGDRAATRARRVGARTHYGVLDRGASRRVDGRGVGHRVAPRRSVGRQGADQRVRCITSEGTGVGDRTEVQT